MTIVLNPKDCGGFMTPESMIIMYVDKDSGGTYAEYACIENGKVQAFMPISESWFTHMKKMFSEDNKNISKHEIIDDRLIYDTMKSYTGIVWKFNKCKRSISINDEDFEVTLPRGIFMYSEGRLYIYAIASNSKLTLQTDLYHYPLPNISIEGNVCMGNIRFDDSFEQKTKSEQIDFLECVFWKSVFTHTNNNTYTDKLMGFYRNGESIKLQKMNKDILNIIKLCT